MKEFFCTKNKKKINKDINCYQNIYVNGTHNLTPYKLLHNVLIINVKKCIGGKLKCCWEL